MPQVAQIVADGRWAEILLVSQICSISVEGVLTDRRD
jgi:hypothetical protein